MSPLGERTLDVINPATESTIATIALGNAADVDRAVAAARRAFPAWSSTSVADRLALLDAITARYQARMPELHAMLSNRSSGLGSCANS